jgi:dienelactone hydrolase
MAGIPAGGGTLVGDITIPPESAGLVIFAHGSGSSRLSPRNRFVARMLSHSKFATLLVDLLTPEEEAVDAETGHLRFNIDLLANRLAAITKWVQAQPDLAGYKIGYFGSSTGGAAALVAAARHPGWVDAVVSRGGRPDLARGSLAHVQAPTLLIVGELDDIVLDLNRWALIRLKCAKKLVTIPGATHLFEEPGCLQQVAHEAAEWFSTYLVRAGVH